MNSDKSLLKMAKRRHNIVRSMELSNKIIDMVWSKGDIVPFESPALYRRDSRGRIIYRFAYALRSGRGWDVGYTLSAKEKTGDEAEYLEPLHWETVCERKQEEGLADFLAKIG